MIEVTNEETKTIVLELLEFFDKLCREHDIEYSLSGGTLLGSVRHGGFIPWDDDGDVMLSWNNYEKMRIIFGNIKSDKFGYIDQSEDGYNYMFGKLYCKETYAKLSAPQDLKIKQLGVYIDIFPIYKLPGDAEELEKFDIEVRQKLSIMNDAMPRYHFYSKNKIKMVIKFCVRIRKIIVAAVQHKNMNKLQQIVIKEITKFNKTSATNAGFILSEYGKKESIDKKVFDKYKDVNFENHTFRSVDDTDTYLSALYGNYMKLPPLEKRIPKHSDYQYFWK